MQTVQDLIPPLLAAWDQAIWLAVASAATLGLVFGSLITGLLRQRRIAALRRDNAVLQAQVDAAERLSEERERAFREARDRLGETFSALSGEALRHNNETFLHLAEQRLGRYQVQARAELGEREKAVESLVRPIREALQRTEGQIRELEKTRQEAYGGLTRHLQGMAEMQAELRAETGNLVKALRRPEVRGRWGEITLRRLVELAGMVEHCDFYEQEHTGADDRILRPDMVVRLPSGRELVMDAKTPLDAYVDAIEADDEAARAQALTRHARGLRRQVQQLAAKAYWSQFRRAPDFVILFIPGEQFLTAAQDQDSELLDYALRNKVILATPPTLVALLRAVAYGWRQERLADNAEHIRELGETLYARLSTFTEHLSRLGKSLGGSVDQFNKAVGSLERQVLPSARRFTELGVAADKPLQTPPAHDIPVRKATTASPTEDE